MGAAAMQSSTATFKRILDEAYADFAGSAEGCKARTEEDEVPQPAYRSP